MAGEIKVRTTMTPWKETVLKGGQRELDDLTSKGLIYTGSATTDDGRVKSAAEQVVKARTGKAPEGDGAGEPVAGNPDKIPG